MPRGLETWYPDAMLFFTAYRRRNFQVWITINGADGNPVSVPSNDAIRCKIGRSGEAPLLDIDNKAATANGSVLSDGNPTRLIIRPGDLNDISPGIYDLEIGFVDDSDSDAFKHAEKGTFVLVETQLGDTGLS